MGESKNSETYQIGKNPERTWPKNWVWMRKQIAALGEVEGDSLDLVETTMALEEAFGSTLQSGAKVDLGRQAK